ncbi:MAG: hypothetical protein ACRDSK_00935 [Actinophytocola sp.]|uniref:hypothetical protein n=1 Tax=Actinophytocola sp. TaxID=1872138 RepID=UPI003D6AC8DC
MNPQPSSRTLALAAAGVITVVCGAVVTALLLVREMPPSEAESAFPFDAGTETYAEPDVYTETETFETYTETDTAEEYTTESPLDAFQQVTGPGGMTTYVPSGWPTKRATGPGAMQADDPTGASILLRYGGSATTELDTFQVHADYEQDFAANRSGYDLVHLDRSTVRGMSAVDWEFEYDPQGDVRRHVRSIYWLSQGYDYFVYVSAPVDQWPQAQEILDVMLDNATP